MVKTFSKEISGWGRYPRANCNIYEPSTYEQIIDLFDTPLIARGMGRSYGDSSLQPIKTVVTKNLNKILYFNNEKGLITVQSGINVLELIDYILPKGWFIPVSAGTKYVSIGGMVASDVHGKNHHKDGSFGNFVKKIKLINSEKQLIECSPTKNSILFWKTIGGMGLTGVILEVTFSLLLVETSYIKNEITATRNLQETMQEFEFINSSKYVVAWIDCTTKGKNFGKSIVFKGEHVRKDEFPEKTISEKITIINKKKIKIPFVFPSWVLSPFTIKIFNFLYYLINSNKKTSFVDYDTFFYPLDAIENWNLIYGTKGFIQYQFVIPKDKSFDGLTKILKIFNKNKIYPFLTVLKLMGSKNKGALSFPMKGYTLACDFPINKNLFKMLDEIDLLLINYNGRVYLSKDSRISKKSFNLMYADEIKSFNLNADLKTKNKFSSLQSERLDITNL